MIYFMTLVVLTIPVPLGALYMIQSSIIHLLYVLTAFSR